MSKNSYESRKTAHAKLAQGQKSKYLVVKGGRKYNKNVEEFLYKNYGDPEKDTSFRDYESYDEAKFLIDFYSENGMPLTMKKLKSLMTDNAIERMINNAGYTPEEAAVYVNSTVDHLLDSENWDGDMYTNPAGVPYQFIFSYKGDGILFSRRR